MKTVLVTGSAGFIGFHVAKALLDGGLNVLGVDDFNDAYDVKIKEMRNEILVKYPNFKLFRKDITDLDELKEIFEQNEITKVCHLAARVGVLPSLKNPLEYEKTNILGTLNIFELMKSYNVKPIVLASSSSVYGANTKFPSSEEDKVDNPISFYAATKKTCELIGHYYASTHNFHVTVLRFFNVYGEWGRPDMMPWIFTENILNGKKIVVNNYGDTWKDYTYIDDITNGVITALNSEFQFEIINLGNHTPVHLKKCIEIIENETGKKAIVELKGPVPGDVLKSFADVSKAKRLLEWEPTTSIEQGLHKFVYWYKNYFLAKIS